MAKIAPAVKKLRGVGETEKAALAAKGLEEIGRLGKAGGTRKTVLVEERPKEAE